MPDSSSATALGTPWLGLVVGNTRLHWGFFRQQQLLEVWHTPHLASGQAAALIKHNFGPTAWRSLSAVDDLTIDSLAALGRDHPATSPLPLQCASVVPPQTALWQGYPGFREVTLADLPLANLYPTLGIDRALNLLGAGDRVGWPALVIDAGTALTFTAGTAERCLGGAILPGLTTQFATLAEKTATLPATHLAPELPPRWANNTADALRSGIVYGLLATIADYIQAWRQEYPTGHVVLTGGDGPQLHQYWQRSRSWSEVKLEPHLTFWGLSHLQLRLTSDETRSK